MITVLLVDDHASVRKSLRYLLESTEDIEVVATASSGMEAVAQAHLRCPDVAVIDVAMPNMDGIETTRQLRTHCQSTRVMLLSIFDNAEYVLRALDVGAQGYILKDRIAEDLLSAIRTLSNGRRYFSQTIAEIAQKYFDQTGKDSSA